MEISFDPAKRASNLAKHGLDLADAKQMLDGRCVEWIDERDDYGEDRWISLGVLRGDIVACVWTDWIDTYRVISLRKASEREILIYLRSLD